MIQKPAFTLTFFRPGIGTVDIDRLQAVFAQVLVHQVAGFYAHHQDICQPGSLDAAAGLTTTLVENIDGDKVAVRVPFRNLDNKVSYAAADFQGKRIAVAEQGGKATGFFKSRLGDKYWRVDQGHSLGHVVVFFNEGCRDSC